MLKFLSNSSISFLSKVDSGYKYNYTAANNTSKMAPNAASKQKQKARMNERTCRSSHIFRYHSNRSVSTKGCRDPSQSFRNNTGENPPREASVMKIGGSPPTNQHVQLPHKRVSCLHNALCLTPFIQDAHLWGNDNLKMGLYPSPKISFPHPFHHPSKAQQAKAHTLSHIGGYPECQTSLNKTLYFAPFFRISAYVGKDIRGLKC